MTWHLEVREVHGDERLLGDVLANLGYRVEGGRISGQPFEGCATANEAWEIGKELRQRVGDLSHLRPDLPIGFEIGSVIRVDSDGTESRTVFGEAKITLGAVTVSAVGTVTGPELSAEDRARHEREQKERQHEVRVREATRILQACGDDGLALEVLHRLSGDPSMTDLGNIVELIQNDMKGEIGKIASKNRLTLFDRSINHPEVFGRRSRHAVSRAEPPEKPMTEEEARNFVNQLARDWIDNRAERQDRLTDS